MARSLEPALEDLQAVLDRFVAALRALGDLSLFINICKTEVL